MLDCRLCSPDRTFFEGKASSVTARSPKGEFAVLPHHAPLLAELAPGRIRIQTPDGELRFACFGGTFSVKEDRVVVLGFDITPEEDIDLEAARSAATDAASSDAEREAALARLRWLENLVRNHD
jgi:F-type H+-transporting ATPase subunit epsilon